MRKIKCKEGSCSLASMDSPVQIGGGGLDVRAVDYLVPFKSAQKITRTAKKSTKQTGGKKRKASTKSKVVKAKPRKTTLVKKK